MGDQSMGMMGADPHSRSSHIVQKRINLQNSGSISNLPSDIESDESSLREAEDVMTEKVSSSENTDIDEEKMTKILPGPPRIFEVIWENKAL
ncbi:hypothetical protein TNIN_134161 [Trichonephila inaurata madagascariensis]|uniref:Uncharacterized protein n=1 Tax=Trichonephila inaurata madagascariensis TaxID=2747483 RepID=A0A8X6KBJ0_9ARAC|nr:hypothetical protein TNIN_134161 [Trichonephila inaurata madagascariensis]